MTPDDVAARRGRHRLRATTQWTMTAAVLRHGPLVRWRLRRRFARVSRPALGG